ncbi:MAG TPA: hypothetical protein VKB80_02800 [Kofleriaceae bacterium]|nr:hypothetical protein [Kofleriaceae bacterium]
MRRATFSRVFAVSTLLALCAVLAAAPLACGGGGAEGGAAPAPAPAGQGTAPPAKSPEEQLRAAQKSAIHAMCERLVDCALEEARATMTPDEVAKLEAEDRPAQLRDKCEGEGAQSSLSPRQVRVVQQCVSQPGTCDELNTCLDQARKKE